MVTALFLLLASQAPTPPVRVWLGSGQVYVQTSADGHLVVLHARPDGRVEVLFPDDPASDPFVRAGTYEIRGPVASGDGRGMVVAALSPDPIWFDEFVHRSNWDVASLTGAGASADPEALLTDIVQRMLGDGSFNYDVVTYTVAPRPAAIVDAVGDTPEPAGACIECSFTQVEIVVGDILPRRHFSHRRRRGAAPAVAPATPTPAAIAVYSVHRPLEPLPLRVRRPATRSQLLVRFVHAARNEPVSARVLAVPAPALATAGMIAVPAPAPAPVAAPEPRVVARPAARIWATSRGAPASARAGSATGVPLGAVHTAGWRH